MELSHEIQHEAQIIDWLAACLDTFKLPADSAAGERLTRQLSILYDKGLVKMPREKL